MNRNDQAWSGDVHAVPSIPNEYRALAARLKSAEDQIFPLVMVDPGRYQRAVSLIGLLAGHFNSGAASLADLEGARATAIPHARELASRNAIVTGDLDLDTVVDAAMSQRFRLLLVLEAAPAATSRVEEARLAGLAWAALAEPDAASLGLAPDLEWVDLHIASSTELIRTISMDLTTGQALFRVTVRDAVGNTTTTLCPNRQEWLRTADEAREQVEVDHPVVPGMPGMPGT